MTLFSIERRWLLTVLDAILPARADPRLTLGARDVPMERFVGDLLRRAPTLAGIGVRASLWVVWLGPLLRGRLGFGALSDAERIAWLETLAASPIHLLREVPVLLKTLACLGFCGVPDVQRQVGIAPVADAPPRWMR
jgi:hypothetical protein